MAKKEFNLEEFQAITALSHSEQAIWWLNGFWDEAEQYAERLWDMAHLACLIETGKPKLYGSSKKLAQVKEGCDLDEFQAHQFLEKMGETLTVVELRKRLKAVDVDSNGKMALIEYLLAYHKKTPREVNNAPQGSADPKILAEAQKGVDDASEALADAQQAQADSEAAKRESEAAKVELEKAEAEVQAQVEAAKAARDAQQKLIDDESLSGVKRNTARQVLAQLEAEDPLPLRKAQITAAAAVKRQERAIKAAAKAIEAAKAAVAKAEEAFAAAQTYLEDVKAKGGDIAKGKIWWLERELAERKKFMPK
jgi:hypothetical protein